jgi:SNF2 family DNA or RNA helicase
MRWLDRKRKNLIDKYRTELKTTTLSDVMLESPTVYQNKAATFVLEPTQQTEEIQFFPIDKFKLRVAILDVEIHPQPTDFDLVLHSADLFSDERIKVTPIALREFPLAIHRFTFQKTRQERTLFPPKPIIRTLRPPIVTPPTPPPPHPPTVDLEERLRWILTPPIDELISDPQLALPEKPFPFQTIGIKWLYDRDSALLADEMGLGKTMQALISARLLWRSHFINQILVICPKTLIPTWQTEIRKWWPQIAHNVMVMETGADRQFFLRLGTSNVVIKIINYDSLARENEWLEKQTFSHDLIIIDEAQRIKNPNAKASRAVKALKAPRRWALTGTPLENKIDDLISIFDFVRPGLFRDEKGDMSSQYAGYFLGRHDIKDIIRPYLLRRRTEEVMPELPEKSEQDIEIELEPPQYETYKQMEEEGVIELNAKGDTITVTHVFALINKLRQFCNFDPVTGTSAKLERLLEDLEEVAESDRKALIFSQFVEEKFGLKRLAKELEAKGWRTLQLHGEVPQKYRSVVVETFNSDPNITSLLLNFKVGGLGLNLQAANYVFLFDRWWNPAVEDQAVKRAHRIGQTHKVFIRRFYCKDTIEERILQKLAEKRRLFRNIIDETQPQPDSLGLTEEEIFSLFNLTVRPRKKGDTGGPATLILENMDPTQFEILVAQLYEKQGYTCTHLGGSHDQGIDILAEKVTAGGKERIVIQCKHQQAKVGRPALQQLWGVVTSDPSFTRGDLVTSSYFTAEAQQFAQGKRLTLIDRPLLEKLVHQFNVARFHHPSE